MRTMAYTAACAPRGGAKLRRKVISCDQGLSEEMYVCARTHTRQRPTLTPSEILRFKKIRILNMNGTVRPKCPAGVPVGNEFHRNAYAGRMRLDARGAAARSQAAHEVTCRAGRPQGGTTLREICLKRVPGAAAPISPSKRTACRRQEQLPQGSRVTRTWRAPRPRTSQAKL